MDPRLSVLASCPQGFPATPFVKAPAALPGVRPDLGLGEDGHRVVPLAEGPMGWGHVGWTCPGVQAQLGP